MKVNAATDAYAAQSLYNVKYLTKTAVTQNEIGKYERGSAKLFGQLKYLNKA